MNEQGPKLLIVESPAKIKTISKFLGKDYKILSTVGHIKDLPPRKLGVVRDENNHLQLEYVTIKDKASKIADICKQAQQSSAVYLASDPDREGEIIAWHIGQEIEKVFADPSRIYRITFNEITKSAVQDAIEHKRAIDLHKVNAQQARRILDRWVGYEVSPILWKKIGKGLSAGRVQSVAVYLICQRDEEIKSFVPEESWSVHAIFTLTDGSQIRAELAKISAKTAKLKNKADVEAILPKLKQQAYEVAKITDKERLKNPPPPFITSSLQQDAYNKLGFSVDKTMMVAQKLYEGVPLQDKNSPEALITYMRTDSMRIADSALETVRAFIGKEYGEQYLPKSPFEYEKKGAQDAHEAIRPIEVKRHPRSIAAYLGPDEAKLYELIWKRFVACQMQSAKYFQRQVLIDGGPFQFKATGSTLMFDGFLHVYLVEEEEEEENVKIPASLKLNAPLDLKSLDPKQHFTQPPPRYSEATLVKELEKQGIGRPSTYAAILSTIQKRGYVTKEAKRFMPTELGRAVNEMLVAHLADIINVTFTAKMEEQLDKIAGGQVDRDEVLNEFYEKFAKDLASFGVQGQTRKAVPTDLSCPKCDKPLVVRLSKNGEFLGCSGFPECTFTSNLVRNEEGVVAMAPQDGGDDSALLNLTCPQCGKQLTRKMGRFGPFIACSGYPDCKYIHQEQLKTPCPQCGGKLTKRRWKGGTFWGCASYPECKYAIFGAVVEVPCKKCKAPLMTLVKDRDGNAKQVCADKACGYSEPAPG